MKVTLDLTVGTHEFNAVWTALQQFADNSVSYEETNICDCKECQMIIAAARLIKKFDDAVAAQAE